MMVKILKCIAYEDVLRILNIVDYKKKVKENELYDVLDIPKFEIHKHIKELINLPTVFYGTLKQIKIIFFLNIL